MSAGRTTESKKRTKGIPSFPFLTLSSAEKFVEDAIRYAINFAIPPLNRPQLDLQKECLTATLGAKSPEHITAAWLPARISLFLAMLDFPAGAPEAMVKYGVNDLRSRKLEMEGNLSRFSSGDFDLMPQKRIPNSLNERVMSDVKLSGKDLTDAFDLAQMDKFLVLIRWAQALVDGNLKVEVRSRGSSAPSVAGLIQAGLEMTNDLAAMSGRPLIHLRDRYQTLIFLAARFPKIVQPMPSFRQVADTLFEKGLGNRLASDLGIANKKLSLRNRPGGMPDPLLLVMAANWTNPDYPFWLMQTGAALEALTKVFGFELQAPSLGSASSEYSKVVTVEKFLTHRKRHFSKPADYPIQTLRVSLDQKETVRATLRNGMSISV